MPAAASAPPAPTYVPGEVIVAFKQSADSADRIAIRREHRAKIKRGLGLKGLQLVKVPSGSSGKAAAKAIAREREVRYALPNARYDYATIPNDPKFGLQWGLNNTGQALGPAVPGGLADADIDAPEAWNTTTGDSAVTVAVVDSGVDVNHPDLASQIWHNPGESGSGKETNGVDDDGNGKIDDWRGWDFVRNDNDPRDALGHGTGSASTIGARTNDGTGMAGVSWQSKLMPLRVNDAATLIAAFAYAGANGARVVNASIECYGVLNCATPALRDAVNAAPNTLFVAAAGNSGVNAGNYDVAPCTVDAPNVICVGATDRNDNLAPFSNFGVNSVDLAAPGDRLPVDVPVWSPVFSEGFESDIGSSWTSGGVNDSWGRTTEEHEGPGSYSLADSPGNDYLPSTDSYIQKVNPIDLSGQVGCRLDYGYITRFPDPKVNTLSGQVSADGVNWSGIGTSAPSGGSGFGALSADISALDGESIYLRFKLHTASAGVPADGVYIDNVQINCLDNNYSATNGYATGSGTSIAAPYVSGAAALLFAQDPARTAANAKAALLNTVDVQLSSSMGKIATAGRLNIRRALTYSQPAAPGVTTTTPASGSDNNVPKVKGTVPPGTNTVYIYKTADCTGGPAASASAATFTGAGILVGVTDNSTTTFHARAFSDSGGLSECSAASVTYKETTKPKKYDSVISSAGSLGLIRNKTFAYGSTGLRVDQNAGWTVGQDSKRLAVVSANSSELAGNQVQPGGCPIVALGTKTLKAIAFYNIDQDEGDSGFCLGSNAQFGSVTMDAKSRQVAFSANFAFDVGIEATEEAPQIYLWKSGKITPVTVSGGNGWASGSPALSSDGLRLYFASNGDFNGQNEDGNTELFSYDTVGKQITQITHTDGCGIPLSGSPGISVSGDGNRVVFQSSCDLAGTNPSGENRAYVYERSSDTYTQLQFCVTCSGGSTLIEALTISQDGNTVANYFGHFLNGVHEKMMIHQLSSTANVETDFQDIGQISFDFGNGVFGQRFAAPSLSANGKRVVFTAQYDPLGTNGDHKTEVFLIDRRSIGDEIHQLTDTGAIGGGGTSFSAGQAMDANGKVVYITSNGVLWGKQTAGAFRVRLKPALP